MIRAEELRKTVQKMKPGGIFMVSPDIHDKFVAGQVMSAAELAASGVSIQRAPELAAGKAMIVYSANLGPSEGWANQFLNKSGPPSGSFTVPTKPAQPATPEPTKPPVAQPMPRPRQRIVDT
jgi:hypothetical protein